MDRVVICQYCGEIYDLGDDAVCPKCGTVNQ